MIYKTPHQVNKHSPVALPAAAVMFVILLSMLGCNYLSYIIDPRLLTPIAPTATIKKMAATPTTSTETPVSLTDSPQAEQPTPQITQSCAYVWSSQPLLDISNQLQVSFNAVGLAKIKVLAEAYGEVCLNTETNAAGNLIVLHTDFKLDIPVDSIQEEEKLGQLIYSSLNILARQNTSTLPGKRMGYVIVKFHSADKQEINLRFPLETGMKNIEKGLRGVELYQAIKNQ
jgi:hypothetical protein